MPVVVPAAPAPLRYRTGWTVDKAYRPALDRRGWRITASQIRLFETGERRIPPRRLIEAAEFFRIPVNAFFEGAPDTHPSAEVSRISADVMRFLAMPESIALVSAFVDLPCVQQRQAVVEYARSAADYLQGGGRH